MFRISIYLIPKPKTIYDLGAQNTQTLTYPRYTSRFCRHEANSKHQINANATSSISEDSRNLEHWKSGPAGNTTVSVTGAVILPTPHPLWQYKATQHFLAKKEIVQGTTVHVIWLQN